MALINNDIIKEILFTFNIKLVGDKYNMEEDIEIITNEPYLSAL